MIMTNQATIYKAFGLIMTSDIPLPELQVLSTCQPDQIDVIIELTDLSPMWREAAGQQKILTVRGNNVMFKLPGIGTFCIQGNDRILVSPAFGSDPDQIRLYILGTCLGVILMQRRILPLHGSAIAIHGKVYAVVGESGAGKSTLASVLLNKGYQLLSDDVIALKLPRDKDNPPLVMPSYPRQKLWKESIVQLGMQISDYQPLFERENKFAIPVASKFYSEDLPLAGIFELVKVHNDHIIIQEIHGLERISVLHRHTYRKSVIASLGLSEWHFKATVDLLKHIKIFRLQRPDSGFTAVELTELLLSQISFNSE